MKRNTGVHSPNRLLPYQEIHETVMNQFRDTNFISDHTLRFYSWRRFDDISLEPVPQIRLYGEITCRGKILVRVDKYLDILENDDENPLIQTVSYAYNASVQGVGNIFRYDNQDDYFVVHDGHEDEHHKHIFNWYSNQQIWEKLVWVGYENWPTLGKFITELEEWYWNNRDELAKYVDDPDGYAVLGIGIKENISPSNEI